MATIDRHHPYVYLDLGGSIDCSELGPEETATLIARARAAAPQRYARTDECEFWVAQIATLDGEPGWVVFMDWGQAGYSLHSEQPAAVAEFEQAVKEATGCPCDPMEEHTCTLDDRWNVLDPATRELLDSAGDRE